MRKTAMNRRKRLDAPSKQESRERYESARRRNPKEDTNDDLSSTSELPKQSREDSHRDMETQSSDLRDKIPKLSRTIAGNDETGSLVVNVGKKDSSTTLSLVDPSYDDTRMPVEKFNYSHKRSDSDPVGDDGDDLRALIERQRRTDKPNEVSNKDDKTPNKSGSTFFDSKFGYTKEYPKSKTSENYRDSKRKDSKDSKSASGKSDRYSKPDVKSKTSKGKDNSKSSYELGFAFFSSSGSKNKDKPAEEMDINETLKELAYLRSIQTGDNALPKEEEEYFRKLNDLSKPNLASQFDLLFAGKTGSDKADGARKTSIETVSKIESKWDGDSTVGKKAAGNTTNDDEMTYGPSLPPKKSSLTSKKVEGSTSTGKSFSRERSSSTSKSDHKASPIIHGSFRGRGFRGRGVGGSFRGRGRGRDAQGFSLAVRGRGRGRSRGRFIRGGFIPSRGRHIFSKGGARIRKSRSRSSSRSRSRSTSYSRNRSRSRSRGRSNKRRRSSSRSSYSSSSYSRSRSRSQDRSRGRKQTKRRSRSRSYSSRSRSRSRSRRRSHSRSTSHSRSRKRSRSLSRSGGSYKKQSKDRERSRSKSSSRSRRRRRKDRSRSWSFDEDYTKKKSIKTTSNASGAKITDSKNTSKKEQEEEAQSRPKKEKTETTMAKPKNKDKTPKLEQNNQDKAKTQEKCPENTPENPPENPRGENFNSPGVALKDLKVTAFSNVFLPRTVSKNVGNISKGMSIVKGRMLPLKKHPLFDAQEEEPQEKPEKIDPKEVEKMKEEKQRFDSEVDKVFDAKSDSKDADTKRGSWKRVWPPEESTKNEETLQQQEQEKEESVETKSKEMAEEMVVEDQRIVETKDTAEEEKTQKEQKKERKEKRKKEKELKMKKKKEKKGKKEKKNKESTIQENLGNESKEKVACDDGQGLVDSIKPEQYDQEGYSGYNEYPEGEYQYFEETGQEQGWYDENGVYHPYEEEYLYYYDQEGNIVGYEGPEGYVEGNPFEEQQYHYEGEQQEGVQPEMYGQEAYGTEYPGDAEGGYHYLEEGHAVEEPQYTDTDSHWQEYATGVPEQWYAAEGSYPEGGEGYAEYHYPENQEENQYPEQQVSVQHDPNYMLHRQDSSQTFGAGPAQAVEEPNSEDLSEKELVLALGKNLAALARLKGWSQKKILGQDPLSIIKMLQEPAVPAEERQERRPQDRLLEEPYGELQQKPDEIPQQHIYNTSQEEKELMQDTRERNSSISERRVAEEKPLKSILKKGNSASLKPPPKPETNPFSFPRMDSSSSTSDHVGPEYISKSGPDRFFCKLCQCHIESPMAKELHVKSMKHIELFVREKSSLLHSVIGAKQLEDAVGSGLPSQRDKLPEKEPSPQRSHDKRDDHERSVTAEEEATRNRLLDYDRLRLMDWKKREGSVGSVGSDKPKQFDYGRMEDQDLESRTSREGTENERYENRNDPSRWPRETREDWRHHEESYRRERQHYAPERRERDYEKGDYYRERRPLSHDSDRQDDRQSIGSRSSDRSYDGSEIDTMSEHKVQPMVYRNRMSQDNRYSPRDRTQGESSQRARREQILRPEQIPEMNRTDKSREILDQNERGRSREDADAGTEGRGSTNVPPQENRVQVLQDRWHGHGQACNNQNPDCTAQEPNSHSSSSPRTPSSERKEIPRAEDTGRRADQDRKSSEKMNHLSPTVLRSQSQKTSRDDDSNRNAGAAPKDGTQMTAEGYLERAGIKPLASIQSPKEPNQLAPSSNVKPHAALLGDPPKSHTQDQKPQEQANSISTVIQGQRRVPPPPPPYNKGSGPQSFRGRGGQGHPPPHVGGGGHQSHIPPSQPGMMGESPHSHTLLPLPSQAPSYTGAPAPPSSMPPRQFPSDQAMGGHHTPPFYGRGRAVGQPQFRGRGGSPHMAQGGSYGGPPQFASRGRGGRGYHGQRW